jgi:cytochrome c
MKKYWVFIMLFVLSACGSSENHKALKKSTNDSSNMLFSNPVYIKGVEIVGKNNCLTCHRINEKLIGPSYKEIAQKYADKNSYFADSLATKIMAGSVGVWGNIAMPPNTSISKDDASTLASYILLLKDVQ